MGAITHYVDLPVVPYLRSRSTTYLGSRSVPRYLVGLLRSTAVEARRLAAVELVLNVISAHIK